jgi:rhomboid family GlyGly-CTERM serine protease
MQPTTAELSPAERLALAGAALLVLLQAAAPWHELLQYQQGLSAQQPWRVFTAHLVHINWSHALINAAAWFVVARLFGPELTGWRQPLVLAASAVAITLSLALLHPGIAWYRGFSGVLHAVFFAGASCYLLATLRTGKRSFRALWLPAILLLGGAIKVALEQPVGSMTPYAEWLGAGTVPQAHLAGALTGAALGVVFSLGPAPADTAAAVS